MKKWKMVECSFSAGGGCTSGAHHSNIPSSVRQVNGRVSTTQLVLDALQRGETDFVAAGGDGTVNALLNALLKLATAEQLQKIRLGAIGLGSSNDFHKPFLAQQVVGGVPCKIDFECACRRDVGCVTFRDNGSFTSRYFLINASIGATANANDFFNDPDRFLKNLKRFHTPSAIIYAAIKTIISHTNLSIEIQSPEVGTIQTNVTNLGVVKSPHFSGSLHFDHPAVYDNGQFMAHLFSGLDRLELLRLLRQLSDGKQRGIESRSWSTASLTVTAKNPFAVEFDGEVVHTTEARFGILSCYLKVCP